MEKIKNFKPNSQARSVARQVFDRIPLLESVYLKTKTQSYLKWWIAQGPLKSGRPDGKNFVILNHAYDQDIESLKLADTPHTLWAIDTIPFGISNIYFSPEQREFDIAYADPCLDQTKRRYRQDFVIPLVDLFVQECKIDAMIAPSDTFYWFRPVIEELHHRGIPVVIQDKEGTIAPGRLMEEHAQVLRDKYPPIADEFYFWSKRHCEFWHGIGLAPEATKILGQPRSDFFNHPSRWPRKEDLGLDPNKKLAVLFTFEEDAYIASPTGVKLEDRLPWRDLRQDLHQVGESIARANPDVEVIIKAHPQQQDLEQIMTETREKNLPNLRAMGGAAGGNQLLALADVIVGFQSTALIEAMIMKKPVIYIGWGETYQRFLEMGILIPIFESGGCHLPRTKDEFEHLLQQALDGELDISKEMLDRRKAFADQYFYHADGRVGQRVLEQAAKFVDRYSQQR